MKYEDKLALLTVFLINYKADKYTYENKAKDIIDFLEVLDRAEVRDNTQEEPIVTTTFSDTITCMNMIREFNETDDTPKSILEEINDLASDFYSETGYQPEFVYLPSNDYNLLLKILESSLDRCPPKYGKGSPKRTGNLTVYTKCGMVEVIEDNDLTRITVL